SGARPPRSIAKVFATIPNAAVRLQHAVVLRGRACRKNGRTAVMSGNTEAAPRCFGAHAARCRSLFAGCTSLRSSSVGRIVRERILIPRDRGFHRQETHHVVTGIQRTGRPAQRDAPRLSSPRCPKGAVLVSPQTVRGSRALS